MENSKIHLVTYANNKKTIRHNNKDYIKSQKSMTNTYKKYDINTIENWNRNLIMETEFYKENKEILE